MAIDILTLSLARSYTKASLNGLGALKGANCTVKDITTTATGSTVTFEWTGNDGSTQTSQLNIENGTDGKDGSSVTNLEIRQVGTDHHLFCTITDSDGNEQEIDAGILPSVGGANITTDTTPTQGSQNPVQSGGVFDALELKQDKLTGNDGQFVGFDAQGNPIAVDAPDMGTTVIEISKLNYDLLTPDERKNKVYYIYDDDENQGQTLEYADQRPTTTNAQMGDIVFNSLPEPAGFVGWVYTAFGWLGFGTIESTRTVQFILNDNAPFMVNDGTGTGNGTPFLYRDVMG